MRAVREPSSPELDDRDVFDAAEYLLHELVNAARDGRETRSELLLTDFLSLMATRLRVDVLLPAGQQCFATLLAGKQTGLASLLASEMAMACCRSGEYGDGLAFSERAIHLAEQTLHEALAMPGSLDEDESLDDPINNAQAALALAKQAQGACLTSVGDYSAAQETLDEVEVPAERPDILFFQALCEARLAWATASDSVLEIAGIAFNTAHRYGLWPSRCSLAALLLAAALEKNGRAREAQRHLLPALEYLIRCRLELLLSPILRPLEQAFHSRPTLANLVELVRGFCSIAQVRRPEPEERSRALIAIREHATNIV
jgi:tetratricopeptide (TPR) repeat protein